MLLLIITSSLVIGVLTLVLFFAGVFDIAFKALLRLAYQRHKQLRREQRPQRIFLIRHGESQANIDTSKQRTLSIP